MKVIYTTSDKDKRIKVRAIPVEFHAVGHSFEHSLASSMSQETHTANWLDTRSTISPMNELFVRSSSHLP